MNQPPSPRPAAISGRPASRAANGNRGRGSTKWGSKPTSHGPAKSSGGGAMTSGWGRLVTGSSVIDLQIEDRALATHIVDLPAEQAVHDDGAAPSHKAEVGIRHAAHVPGRILRVDPQLGRAVPVDREIFANGEPIAIPAQPLSERLHRLGQDITGAGSKHDHIGAHPLVCAPSVAECEIAALFRVLQVDDLMAGQQADSATRGFQELEIVEPVIDALQQALRYAVARHPLLA